MEDIRDATVSINTRTWLRSSALSARLVKAHSLSFNTRIVSLQGLEWRIHSKESPMNFEASFRSIFT